MLWMVPTANMCRLCLLIMPTANTRAVCALPNCAVDYTMLAVSSFDNLAEAKCPGDATSPLDAPITDDVLRRFNWLVNNYYNTAIGAPTTCVLPQAVAAGTFGNDVATLAGAYGPVDSDDMQTAIWFMTGVYGVGWQLNLRGHFITQGIHQACILCLPRPMLVKCLRHTCAAI
jgi:hypothetical protein